jgi:hypothetical protein
MLRCNPIIRLLDPKLHTVSFVQERSALLFTAILHIASQCLPSSSHSRALESRLGAHIEYLLKEVTVHGYQVRAEKIRLTAVSRAMPRPDHLWRVAEGVKATSVGHHEGGTDG